MPVASTSRAQVAYILESVYGTIPGAGTPKNIRVTGESLDFAVQTETSKEIRSDRQVTDLVQVGASASGGFNMELSYNEFDAFIEATMQGTWVVFGVNGVGAVIPTSATFAASTLTAGAATSGASIFTALALGQWVSITGSSIPGQNTYAQVSLTVAPTSTVLTFQGTPFTGLTGNGGAAVKLSTSRLVNGVTQRSYAIEKSFNDIVQFFAYRGMTASKMDLTFQSGSILGGQFGFMGKDAVRGAVTALPAVPTASLTYDIMNAVTGVGQVMEGGALLTGTFIKSLSLGVDNKLRGRTAIGTLGNVEIGSGSLEVKGNLEVYLANGTLYDKFLANTATSLSLRATDSAGNGYIFTMPKVRYSDAKVQAGGMDQDAMLSLPFTALMDPATGKTLLIDRVGVAVV